MFVISSANWIMCELVRVFHSLPIDQAQLFVDKLAEIRVPLVWKSDDVRRVLHPKMTQKQQILLLLASASEVSVNDLSVWLEVANRSYFFKTLRSMHKQRLIELNEDKGTIVVLPPGAKLTEDLIRKFVTF